MFGARIIAAAAAATVLAGAGAASAQGLDGGFYLKGFGGFTIPQNDNFSLESKAVGGGSASTGFNYDTGYVVGAAAGYQVTPNVSVELEYAFRNADADFKSIDGGGTTQSNAIMANAIYTFPGMGPNGAFKPYLGAGLGAADLNFNGKSGVPDFNGDFNFAYQVITGVGYDINPNWTLNGEVRFFGINDQDLETDDLKFKSGYQTFDALIGATYHF